MRCTPSGVLITTSPSVQSIRLPITLAPSRRVAVTVVGAAASGAANRARVNTKIKTMPFTESRVALEGSGAGHMIKDRRDRVARPFVQVRTRPSPHCGVHKDRTMAGRSLVFVGILGGQATKVFFDNLAIMGGE